MTLDNMRTKVHVIDVEELPLCFEPFTSYISIESFAGKQARLGKWYKYLYTRRVGTPAHEGR